MKPITIVKAGMALFAVLVLATSFAGAATMEAPLTALLGQLEATGPVDVAAGADGAFYAADFKGNAVVAYDRNFNEVARVSVSRPVSVATTPNGDVLVGSQGEGSVKLYDKHLAKELCVFGNGAGEFGRPKDIAVTSGGMVLVADQSRAVVTAYDLSGSRLSLGGSPAIGGKGVADGQFWGPVGVAVDESAGLIHVLDTGAVVRDPATGKEVPLNRVQSFRLSDGGHANTFGGFGLYDGKLYQPTGLSVDDQGRIYVTDAMQWCVHVFAADGTPLSTIASKTDPVNTPSGLGFAGDRLYVTSASSGMVQVYGIDDWVDLFVAPGAVSFVAQLGKPAPAAVAVTISNGGPGTMAWTVSASEPWISASATQGSLAGVGETTIDLSVDATGLAPNTSYTGTITVADGRGVTVDVGVSLTVELPPTLSVNPPSLYFEMNEGGANPVGQALEITVAGDGETTVVPTVSTTDGFIQIAGNTVLVDGQNVSAGELNGAVTVSAPGCDPETVVVPVKLVIIGSTVDPNAGNKPGNIVVGRAASNRNDTRIRVLAADGSATDTDFIAFAGAMGGVNVAVGDVNGDGTDEIVAALTGERRNRARIAIFSGDGVYLAGSSAVVFDSSRRGANVAAADFDGDGNAEIVVGTDDDRGTGQVRVLSYNATAGTLVDTGLNFEAVKSRRGGAVGVAVGDVDGNGTPEILAYGKDGSGGVNVWTVDVSSGLGSWSVSAGAELGAGVVAVSALDMGSDGTAEIAVLDSAGQLSVLGADGAIIAGPFVTNVDTNGATLATGNVDADVSIEVLIGAGGGRSSASTVTVLDIDAGSVQSVIEAYTDGYGASVAVGDLGL